MAILFGKREVELGGPHLGELRDANDLVNHPDQLRERLKEDGYLLIRGLHDREKVLRARSVILQHMARHGCVADDQDVLAGLIKEGTRPPNMLGYNDLTQHPELLDVFEGDAIVNLMSTLFNDKEVKTFEYKWLRAVGRGGATGSHYDVVYMGRGSLDLMTGWVPMGDIEPDQGTLALCVGSHRLAGFEKVRQTYGHADVDRDLVDGMFSHDPYEIVEKFGGAWETTYFHAGDVIIFGMFTMHASTANTTDRWRISCDTRFQQADIPMDERWIGNNPKAHYAKDHQPNVLSVDQSREKWGV